MAGRSDEWLEVARINFDAARATGDRAIVDLMPVEIRVAGEVEPAERGQRRIALHALWQNAFLLSQIGAVVVGIAWLMLQWHVNTLLVAAALVPLAWLGRRRSRSRARPYADWLVDAEVAPAAVVSAHESLSREGPEFAAPAAFLVSFAEGLGLDRLRSAAQACSRLRERDDLQGAEARVRNWLLAFDRRADFGRVPVPASLSGAADTFLVGVGVKRHQLPGGRIDRQVYPLVLRRGIDESGELLPRELWRLDDGRDAGDHAAPQAR